MREHKEYRGIKAYMPSDLAFGSEAKSALDILDSFDEKGEYFNINEVIELYNVFKIISMKALKQEIRDKYSDIAKKLMPVISMYFGNITDNNIIDIYWSVCLSYLGDFWELFCKYKVYERISNMVFEKLVTQVDFDLRDVLKHKEIVKYYDGVLTERLRSSVQTAGIISSKFLQKSSENSDSEMFLPKSFKPEEFEGVFQKYIESQNPEIGVLKVICISQSSKECPISDKLRLRASNKAYDLWKKHTSDSNGINYGVEIQFADNDDIVSCKKIENNNLLFTYDSKWISENLDYPTLLNNFIYLFLYTDITCRSAFPTNPSQIGILERLISVKGIKEYQTGFLFNIENMKSSLEMQGYIVELKKYHIRLEDVMKWFFSDYLPNEFGVVGFVFNAPSDESTVLEKCKMLSSEMDGVIKQFDMYVQDGKIDRELLEMSSNPVPIKQVHSFIRGKYLYAESKDIKDECNLLFSSQSMLSYTEKYGSGYESFYELLTKHKIRRQDYSSFDEPQLDYLESKGTIHCLEDGTIKITSDKVLVLKDLFYHQVICFGYYKKYEKIVSELVSSGDLRYGQSLFSEPEQDYLNFMLNKSEYSNGLDLRNKYIHSTYPIDSSLQQRDYVHMMKIMMLVIIKINDEFCIRSEYKANSDKKVH